MPFGSDGARQGEIAVARTSQSACTTTRLRSPEWASKYCTETENSGNRNVGIWKMLPSGFEPVVQRIMNPGSGLRSKRVDDGLRLPSMTITSFGFSPDQKRQSTLVNAQIVPYTYLAECASDDDPLPWMARP